MGIISKFFAWFEHPTLDTDTNPKEWFLGLIVIVIAAFLWSRVIKQIVEN